MTLSFMEATIILTAVLVGGMVLSRIVQRGYIDFLTPMLAIYIVHYVTRALMLVYLPDWLALNHQVLNASVEDIVEALTMTAAAMVVFTVAYLAAVWRSPATGSRRPLRQPPLSVSAALIAAGVLFRLILRLGTNGLIGLPDWVLTPIETLGWAALAGIFLSSFCWGSRRIDATSRHRAALLALAGTILVIAVDARFVASREAVLQPIITAIIGRYFAQGTSMRRVAITIIAMALPLFIWIGAMKTYHDYELGPGQGYLEAVPVVHEQFGQTWPQFIVGAVQNRFHGLDSLIVIQTAVPSVRPYEPGSVWSSAFLSAFVPRLFWPDKRVGWGTRFAVEFWGMSASSEGSASVGISHLGNFYVYGGVTSALIGMALLGGGLGALARYLRQRDDVYGLAMFALVSLTIFQIDRDLEVALGGVAKLIVIFLMLRYFIRARTGPAAVSQSPAISPRAMASA